MPEMPAGEVKVPEQDHRAAYHASRVVLALAAALITYICFPATPAVESPVLELGAVATRDIISPIAFTVPKDGRELQLEQEAASRSVQPIFSLNPALADSARQQSRELLAAILRAVDASAASVQPGAVRDAAESLSVRLTTAEAVHLANSRNRELMGEALDRAFTSLLASGVTPTGALDSMRGDVSIRRGDTLRSVRADSLLTFSQFLARARPMHAESGSSVVDGLYAKLLTQYFRPTLVYDRQATEARQAQMRASVSTWKYEVREQERIVGANEVVYAPEFEKLQALRDALAANLEGSAKLARIGGSILFDLLVVAVLGLTIFLYRPHLYSSYRSLVTILFVFALVVVAASFISRLDTVRPELVPIAVAAIVFSILFDGRISMIAAMTLAVLIGGQSAFRATNAQFLNLIAGVAGAFSVRLMRQRNQANYSVLCIAGAYALAAIALGLTLDRPAVEILQSSLWGAVNAFVSVAFALLLLPVAEDFTGIDTYPRLLEWSDLNRPLMRRLSLEAPGTYAHTMSIANLSEAACIAIGANGLLARVGAYYHDIGKLQTPQYFVENQPRGRGNPHDLLKAGDSAGIIKDHVNRGLELAEEHRIPKSVRAFITEHHGTGPITYFLEKSTKEDGPPADPDWYKYPGPVPQSAETAVVMLADGVEAATRVLSNPTPEKIREVINHIIKQRMDQGQLARAPLTLEQLETIREQFVRVLAGMHHNRIDYPASAGGVSAEFAS